MCIRDRYERARSELEENVRQLEERQQAVGSKLDEFGDVTKEVIGESMKCQKAIRERFAAMKTSLDEREKEVIAHAKQLEEENIQSLQHSSNELREARNQLAEVLTESKDLSENTAMLEFLDQYAPMEEKMDALLRRNFDIEVSIPVNFELQLDVDELVATLQAKLLADDLLPRPYMSVMGDVQKQEVQDQKPAVPPPAARRRIERTEDVMEALDDLREKLGALQHDKDLFVGREEWTEAASTVSQISAVENEIEKLEKDLLSLKKKDAAVSEQRQMKGIELQEKLQELLGQKDRELAASPVDYHKVAVLVDEIDFIESEMEHDNYHMVGEEDLEEAGQPNAKCHELLEYEQTVLRQGGSKGGVLSFVL
eukprot:TRINITY_DN13641_c0_g1_i7.p1 TRINITY_DN13641_c0_g1~~TRINITY_DN13641_c0_g1_i7.p1  ORF type:complete len:369 (+),score=150.37 TRINITY_DN13641_c0_g1_i7:141-1247(+)